MGAFFIPGAHQDHRRHSPYDVPFTERREVLETPKMAYVITEPCIGTKDKSCVDVCPVDCIHGGDDEKQLFIDPEVCISCHMCAPECPVGAIFDEFDVPERWHDAIERNAAFFRKP